MTLAISKVKTIKKIEDEISTQTDFDVDTKLSLLMKSLTEFYTNAVYIEQIKSIIDQNSVVSLRILNVNLTLFVVRIRSFFIIMKMIILKHLVDNFVSLDGVLKTIF